MLNRLRRSPIVIALTAALFGAGLFAGGSAYAGAGFSDVPQNSFFEDEIYWLVNNGIANGFPNNTFRGNQNITRNQAVLWFTNYNQTIETSSIQQDPPLASEFSLQAPCPVGKRPIAGGAATSHDNMSITDSQPVPGGWLVLWETDDGVVIDPTSLTVWVTCIPLNPAVG